MAGGHGIAFFSGSENFKFRSLKILAKIRSFCGLVARAIRNAIRANRFARIIRNWKPLFFIVRQADSHASLEFSDSRESPDSREIVRINSRESRH